MPSKKKRGPSQRQLRVGEELRHALSSVLLRGECHEPTLDGLSITVSEVRISPDLKNATAYVAPLGGRNSDEALAALNECAPRLRHQVTSRVKLRHSPKFHFELDTSFDQAERINALLQQAPPVRDMGAE